MKTLFLDEPAKAGTINEKKRMEQVHVCASKNSNLIVASSLRATNPSHHRAVLFLVESNLQKLF
jgi:hypothetical protein